MTIEAAFRSARKICKWANSEIQNFGIAQAAFGANKPYEIISENHVTSGVITGVSFKAKLIANIGEELEIAAYRVVTDLRNVLDQAVFAAANVIGTSNPKYASFPFALSEHDFKRRLASVNGTFRGIPVSLHPKLTSFRPFMVQDDGSDGNKILCALNDMANPNKHQVALETRLVPHGIRFKTLKNMNAFSDIKRISDTEYNILRAYITGRNPQIDFNTEANIFIKEAGPFTNKPAFAVFKELHALVEGILTEIEEETLKLTS
jgi:hypothetical protein